MISSIFLSFCAVFLAISYGLPVAVKKNIGDQIITLDKGVEFISVKDLSALDRQTIQPTPGQSAGISNSRIAYTRISETGSGFVIPPIVGVTYSVKLQGSIQFDATLYNTIETFTSSFADSSSSSFKSFYRREEDTFRAKAKTSFFGFFSAAVEYGYSDVQETQDVLKSAEYSAFSEDTRDYFEATESQSLEASYDATYSGTSTGPPGGTVTAFAYISINQLTLTNGKKLNIVQEEPELVIADEHNAVLETQDPGAVTITVIDLRRR